MSRSYNIALYLNRTKKLVLYVVICIVFDVLLIVTVVTVVLIRTIHHSLFLKTRRGCSILLMAMNDSLLLSI